MNHATPSNNGQVINLINQPLANQNTRSRKIFHFDWSSFIVISHSQRLMNISTWQTHSVPLTTDYNEGLSVFYIANTSFISTCSSNPQSYSLPSSWSTYRASLKSYLLDHKTRSFQPNKSLLSPSKMTYIQPCPRQTFFPNRVFISMQKSEAYRLIDHKYS